MRFSPKTVLCAISAVALMIVAPGLTGAQSPQPGIFTADFTNDRISPSHWVLTLHRDGTGHFHADREDSTAPKKTSMDIEGVDRDVQLSKEFTGWIFATAQQRDWFNRKCESGAKVAFQGWKRLSYDGPEGQGSCTFN